MSTSPGIIARSPTNNLSSVYDLDYDLEIPPAMMSLVKLISLSSEEWQKVKGKGKPPKAKLDQDVAEVLRIVLQRRLKQYPTSLEVSVSLGFTTQWTDVG